MKHMLTKWSRLTAVLLTAVAFSSQQSVAKDSGVFTNIVEYEFIKDYATIPTQDDVTIIDSRPMARRYDGGHIPGAVSIPNSKFDKMLNVLPNDKSAMLIFYCGGEKCMLSHKSAYKAAALGYTNVHVYAAGYPEWIAKGNLGSVSAAYVKKAIEKDKALVIDARPFKRKYAKGHVPGAISIPDSSFAKLTKLLPDDKAKPLIFYCGGMKCPLSIKSARKAQGLGYADVRVFQGGYPAWVQAYGDGVTGLTPFATASAEASAKIETGEEGDTITVDSFEAIMESDRDSIHLVDVRDKSEFAAGSMAGSINIPVDELEDRIADLPADKPVVFVCATGARSGEAYDIVKLANEDMAVFFLDAQISYEADGTYTLASNN